MKLLLHICCAPCSIACIDTLRSEGIEPVGYWDNPNIHPFTEYRSRRNCLREYAKSIGLTLMENDEYGLRPFVAATCENVDGRCIKCYEMRMDRTAAFAAQNGFTHICTTLFVSPYQNHELLKMAAEERAKAHGVELCYRDFRPRFREGQEKARELEMYMQKYCGCIFSEEDRYRKKKKTPKAQKEQQP